MRRAVIYARISKDLTERLGVARQVKLCRDLASSEGLDVVEVLVDNDVSAFGRRPRPEFERLVAMLRAGTVRAVIVYHADRLYRRASDLERLVDVLESTKVRVHTVAAGDIDLSTASGRMVARMLGAVAQHESERLGERLKAKWDEQATAGRPPGGRPPFGYSAGYKINPTEAAAVRSMADRVLAGASLLSTARWLDDQGVTTREGRPWHHSSVRATLLNPAIAGLRIHRREVAGLGEWPPILERTVWEEVRSVLADPARRRKRPARVYMLSGLVETTEGDPMIGRPDRGPAGSERRTYATRSPAKRSMSVGADDLEALVVDTLLARLDGVVLPAPDDDRPGMAEVTELEGELVDLAGLRGRGEISLAEWLAAKQPLQERLDEARRTARVGRPTAAERLLGEKGAVRKAWPSLSVSAQRDILAAVVQRVVIQAASRGRWTPIGERVQRLDWLR